MACDRIPYELEICPVCGAGIKFTRGWTWLDWKKYAGDHNVINEGCKCGWINLSLGGTCPICHPINKHQPYGLLWVGEANYTPQTFIQEALIMGVSRKIAAVPKNLKLGETWVLFAHKKAKQMVMIEGATEMWEQTREAGIAANVGEVEQFVDVPAVFYAFRPQSLELLIWQSDAKPEYLEDLAKRNITAIIIPDDDEDHDPDTKTKMTADDRADVSTANKIALIRKSIGR